MGGSKIQRDDARMKTNPNLQLRIHGVDGSTTTFTQDDPVEVQRIVRDAQRPEFLAQDRIKIAGRHSVTTLVVSKIARIDLAGEGLSVGKPPRSRDIVELPEQEFYYQVEARNIKRVERRKLQHQPGQTHASFIDIQLIGGRHIYLKFQIVDVVPAERAQRIRAFLALPGLSFRSAGGGLGIVNLANAVKFTGYPGPVVVPGEGSSVYEAESANP